MRHSSSRARPRPRCSLGRGARASCAAVVVHGHRPVALRPRHARGAVLLVSRAAATGPGALRLARGISRRCRAIVHWTRRSATSRRARPTTRSSPRASSSVSACRRRYAGGEMRMLQVFDGSPAAEAGLARGARIDRDRRRRGRRRSSPAAPSTRPSAPPGGRRGRHRFQRRDGDAPHGDDAQTRGDDPHGVADARVRRRRPQGRLSLLPQLRAAVVAALDAAFACAQGSRRDRAGARPALQRRRPGRRGRAPGQPDRRHPTSDQVFAESRHNDRNRRLQRDAALRRTRRARCASIASWSSPRRRRPRPASWSSTGCARSCRSIVVGDRTYGKPVGQYVLPFCDKVLAPVAFSMVNADGQGDYFDGLPPTARPADDIDHDLGDAAEASLAEALGYVRTGRVLRRGAAALGARADAGPRSASARAAGRRSSTPVDSRGSGSDRRAAASTRESQCRLASAASAEHPAQPPATASRTSSNSRNAQHLRGRGQATSRGRSPMARGARPERPTPPPASPAATCTAAHAAAAMSAAGAQHLANVAAERPSSSQPRAPRASHDQRAGVEERRHRGAQRQPACSRTAAPSSRSAPRSAAPPRRPPRPACGCGPCA